MMKLGYVVSVLIGLAGCVASTNNEDFLAIDPGVDLIRESEMNRVFRKVDSAHVHDILPKEVRDRYYSNLGKLYMGGLDSQNSKNIFFAPMKCKEFGIPAIRRCGSPRSSQELTEGQGTKVRAHI